MIKFIFPLVRVSSYFSDYGTDDPNDSNTKIEFNTKQSPTDSFFSLSHVVTCT